VDRWGTQVHCRGAAVPGRLARVRWIGRALRPVVVLVGNAAGGLAALALLLGLAVDALVPVRGVRAGVRLLARRSAGAPAATAAREVAFLAGHAVAGPAGLAVAALPVVAAWVLVYVLRVAETSGGVSLSLGLAVLAVVGLGVGAAGPITRAQRGLARRLLGAQPSAAARIRELTESRAAVVDLQAAELRRVERDLHDGAQARLIAIRMTLGLARDADPDQARELVAEAWESTGQALADLRALVRGIHPPVLAERGLAGAVESVALLCPVPVQLDVDLPARLPTPVESAAYFAVAEALANVAEHSGASTARVGLVHRRGRLRMTVRDDGRGGADPAAGTGLAGIRRRLSALDGVLTVLSPPGGPSELTMELPCASSSPRTSRSCGTASSGC
jgi:signal transduction histidine kinase